MNALKLTGDVGPIIYTFQHYHYGGKDVEPTPQLRTKFGCTSNWLGYRRQEHYLQHSQIHKEHTIICPSKIIMKCVEDCIAEHYWRVQQSKYNTTVRLSREILLGGRSDAIYSFAHQILSVIEQHHDDVYFVDEGNGMTLSTDLVFDTWINGGGIL